MADSRVPTNGAASQEDEGAETGTENGRTRARAAARDAQPGESPRRPASERDAPFHALSWLLEGITGVAEELRHNDLGLSQEFWVHAYATRREALLALRAAVDDLITKCDADEKREEEQQKRRERRGDIRIDF